MKILAIRGCNIASLEGEFEIDFTSEPLNDTGLYVITGPTGAGKSTILDILSVALYDSIPRLEGKQKIGMKDGKDNLIFVTSPATLLRKGTASGYAEVDFRGVDGKNYRSRWSVKKAREKIDGKIQTPVRSLLNITDNKESKGTSSTILAETEKAIGLSYAQFVQSVLLAQGEFSSFLKSKDNERAEILEKLTGTDIYSKISKKIFQKTRDAAKELDIVKSKMGDIKILTEEECNLLSDESKKLEVGLEYEKRIRENLDTIVCAHNANKELFQKLSFSKAKLNEITEELEKFAPQRKKLELADSNAGLISIYRSLIQREKDLVLKKENKTKLESDLTKLHIGIDESEKEIAKLKTDFSEYIKGEADFLRKIKMCRSLDSEIKIITSKVEEVSKQINSLNVQIVAGKKNISEYQQIVASDATKKDKLEQWVAENVSRQKVAENVNLIVSNLQNCKEYQSVADKALQKIKEEAKRIDLLKSQKTDLLARKVKENDKILILKKEYSGLAEELKKTDIEDLRSKLEKYRKEQIFFSEFIQLKDNFIQQQETKENKVLLLKTATESLNSNIKTLTQFQNSLTNKDGALRQQKEIIDELSLALSSNIKEMRTHLEDGKDCPLCGSKHHPYADKQNDILSDVFSKAKGKYEEINNEVNALNQNIAKIKSDNDHLERSINETEKEIISLNRKEEEIIKSVSDNVLSERYDFKIVSYQFLKEESHKIDRSVEYLVPEITKWEISTDKINKLKDNVSATELLILNLTNDIANNDNEDKLSLNLIKTQNEIIDSGNKSIEKSLLTIDGFFSSNVWRDNWKDNSDLFVSKIQNFSEKWNETNKTILNLEAEISKNKALISKEEKSCENLEKELNVRNLESQKYQKESDDLTVNRKDLLGDNKADDVEAEYYRIKENKTKVIQHKSEILQNQQNGFASLSGTMAEIEKTILNIIKDIETEKQNINDGINSANKDKDEDNHIFIDNIIYISSVSPEELSDIREKDNEIKKNLIKAETDVENDNKYLVENERRTKSLISDFKISVSENDSYREFINNEISDYTDTDSILSTIKIISGFIGEKESRLNLIKAELISNNNNKVHLESVIKECEIKQDKYAEWSILNNEIGSQNGDKFKRIAQQYTLDMLLRNANVQISKIAPRYRLERIDDSLALQVIDREMCDQIRSVHSLSGGETFLVSLTLALALSSLSTKNINIESLFIDEGFGTLDSETLNIVMDALDALRLQGRKVGIITHVKEMTEKIPVKILINKERNGSSSVTVEG